MKTQLSCISVSVLMALQSYAADFGINNVNQDKVKKDKWQCEYCITPETWSGEWSISAEYNDKDEATFKNITDKDDGVALDGAFNIKYRQADSFANIWFNGEDGEPNNPGLNLGVNFGYYLGNEFTLSYKEQARYVASNGLTPYSNTNNNTLLLPSDWLTNPNQFKTFNLELERKTLAFDYRYRSKSAWKPRLSVSQEEKEGTKITAGYSNYQVALLPNNVDYTTTKLSTGVSYSSPNFSSDIAYNYIEFDNNNTQLNWQSPFTANQEFTSLAPDNEFHQLAVKLRFKDDNTHYFASGYYSQATQDEDFITSTIVTPVKSLDAQVNETNIKLKVVHNYNRKTRFSAKASFRERNNTTDQYQFAERYNQVNDYRNNKLELMAQFKQFDNFNLKISGELIEKDRPNQQREEIDEKIFKVSLKEKAFDTFDASIDYSYSSRDGSAFKEDEYALSVQNDELRRFNLADRNKNQIKSWFGYSHSPAFNVDVNAYYSKDDYKDTEVGLTEGEDKGVELSFSGVMSKVAWQVYWSKEEIAYKQSGSDNLATANWWSKTNNDSKQYGFNVGMPNLIEDLLSLALDYNYAEGQVNQSVTQGRSIDLSDYPENNYEQHRVDLHLNYTLSETSQLSGHVIYERNNDVDYFYHNVDIATLPNVMTPGIIGNNYNNTFLSLKYKREF